jgi:hypothetical protein
VTASAVPTQLLRTARALDWVLRQDPQQRRHRDGLATRPCAANSRFSSGPDQRASGTRYKDALGGNPGGKMAMAGAVRRSWPPLVADVLPVQRLCEAEINRSARDGKEKVYGSIP